MIPLTLAEVAAAVDGRPADIPDDAVVTAVTTDSRAVVAGASLFVARVGEHADGHDFAGAAVEAGAVAVMCGRDLPGLPRVQVADPDTALRALGAAVRDRVDPTVVGITGSVGKTTTKDLVAAACGVSRATVAAVGSYNNEVGVPLTLLATRDDTEVLVVELGARGPGQVADLAAAARPDIGIVTSVAGVHLEVFGTLDDVAAAKGELIQALPPGGTAVLNADDARVSAMAARTGAAVLYCSAAGDPAADLVAVEIHLDQHARARFVARTPWGDHDVALPVAGRHHVANALYALAAAGAAGADVPASAAALATATVSRWRGAVADLAGVVVLDDAYNANPTSTVAALDTLAALAAPGRRIAVLGVMAEIGRDHDVEHRRVGAHAASVVDHLVVVGDEARMLAVGARDAGLAAVDEVTDADAALRAVGTPTPGDAVLVKASRVAGLEQVTAALRAQLAPEGATT